DPLELQTLLAWPAARPPRTADDHAVVGLLPVAGLVAQRPAPGLLGLEGVIEQQARVATERLAGLEPGLLPALGRRGRARGQLLRGQEGVGVRRDPPGAPRAVEADPLARGQILVRLGLRLRAGVVQFDATLEDVDLGLAARADLEAELGAAVHQVHG